MSGNATLSKRGPKVPLACLAVFSVAWVALAIEPRSRSTWLLENLLTLAIVPGLVLTYRRFRFSDRAYVQGTIFLVLHTIGSHYTYSDVPLGEWAADAFGLARNHYDRALHFAFGVLLFAASRELVFRRRRQLALRVELGLTVAVMASWSVAYELIEWGAAITVDPEAGTAFLGVQGDVWDCQKDIALACLGAVIAATSGAFRSRRAAREERSAC